MTTAIRKLVERRIGLDPDTLGPSAFAEAVAEGFRRSGIADPDSYAGLLEHDPGAFLSLVDRLVVPETWFFRGAALFPHLARIAAKRIAAGQCFRALSLPCSTGEEPYSLAMTLMDASLPPDRWTIEGCDISPVAVAVAVKGFYREFSFRQTPAALRARYFRSCPDGWELDEAVRQRVAFRIANILDPPSGPEEGYDVILCRNLLIYLTADARCLALDNLERRLTKDGFLGVGHAEPAALNGRGFQREGAEELFLFTKSLLVSKPLPQPRQPVLTPQTHAHRSRLRLAEAAPTPAPPVSPLQIARNLADDGRLADAAAACRAALAIAPSADGYALLGVVLHASKELGPAADALRRALYLNPNHHEALALAAGLADAAGNTTQAQLLRARLTRLPAGGTP